MNELISDYVKNNNKLIEQINNWERVVMSLKKQHEHEISTMKKDIELKDIELANVKKDCEHEMTMLKNELSTLKKDQNTSEE